MDKSFKLTVIGTTALVLLALSSFALAAEIKVAAATVPAEMLAKIKGPFEQASGVKLTVATKGAVQLLQDLDTGSVEMSVAGMAFADWMDVATKDGYKIPDRNAYKYRVIGKDLIKVIVHKDNPVRKLSKEQLKGIFSGKLTNWKEIGGRDQEIILFRSTSMPGSLAIFQKQAMEGEPVSKKIRDVVTLQDVKKQVSQTVGATGLSVAALLDASVVSLDIPEVGRPITAITKGAPSGNILKLFDFIRGEGQKYLSK